MKELQGNSGVKLVECINPRKSKYAVRWNIQPLNSEENPDMVSFIEEIFDHKPTMNEIKDIILSWHNSEIDKKIVSGFTYDGALVWLSTENQFNYKAAYDIAVQHGGINLPVIFKMGTTDKPIYKSFTTVSQLTHFYMAAMKFINETLSEGWQIKDNIDWSGYELD